MIEEEFYIEFFDSSDLSKIEKELMYATVKMYALLSLSLMSMVLYSILKNKSVQPKDLK